jgi:hypothetical protein
MTTYNLSGGIFVFCINSDKTDKSLARFGTRFCIKCGNYKCDMVKDQFKLRIVKIVCNCN